MTLDVKVEIIGDLAHVTLDRPDHGNALDLDALHGLAGAFGGLADAPARAAVFRGEGTTFCRGAELGGVLSKSLDDPVEAISPMVVALHAVVRAMRAVPYPVVAAVRGPIVGAGGSLALACDLRIAGESAVLVPAYMRIGASPDGGLSYFLTRMLGPSLTTALFLRNRRLDATELVRLGLAESVVPDAELFEAADALALSVANISRLSLERLRRLIDQATTHGLDAHLDAEAEAVIEMFATADFKEGVSAFLERRAPNFTGH